MPWKTASLKTASLKIDSRLNLSSRAAAVMITQSCVENGLSLSGLLPQYLDMLPNQQRPFVQELSFGVLRWYYRLDVLLTGMLAKPLRGKKRSVHFILLAGLYQLIFLDKPAYAVVKETVEIAAELNQAWAKGLINAILRRFLRERDQLLENLDHSWNTLYAYPDWLVEQVKTDWKEFDVKVASILAEGNQRPPMTLRVNKLNHTVEEYQQCLQSQHIFSHALMNESKDDRQPLWCEEALVLDKPQAVERLPGFNTGAVSVQDGAAQLAARILDAQSSERVLDACAAPGGKTMHILELQPALTQIVALDVSAKRLQQVAENLHRGGFLSSSSVSISAKPAPVNSNLANSALAKPDLAKPDLAKSKLQLLAADASVQSWWDGELFDRILLDAPCSATGVIRRHPDIKVLRRVTDITALIKLQQTILHNLWGMLKPGGTLLYVTCSILCAENNQQINRFLQTHTDAEERVIQANWGKNMSPGRQILPGEHQMDGFYYARLIKQR
jgi:16S rRNA (cytosine967-C5)-methyltransferase